MWSIPQQSRQATHFCKSIFFGNSHYIQVKIDISFTWCSYQIRNSVKFKRVMQTILSLGNALNQGTARGELELN